MIGEWLKRRESGGVGGDPVGSTDPEENSSLHQVASKIALYANSGVKRRAGAHFWRLTPASYPFLAFNASLVPLSGVKRPEWCQIGR